MAVGAAVAVGVAVMVAVAVGIGGAPPLLAGSGSVRVEFVSPWSGGSVEEIPPQAPAAPKKQPSATRAVLSSALKRVELFTRYLP